MKKIVSAVLLFVTALLPHLACATIYQQILELHVMYSTELFNHPGSLYTCLKTTDVFDAYHCVNSHSSTHFVANLYNFGPKNYFIISTRTKKLSTYFVDYDSECKVIFGMLKTPKEKGKLRINVHVDLRDNVIFYHDCDSTWTPFN